MFTTLHQWQCIFVLHLTVCSIIANSLKDESLNWCCGHKPFLCVIKGSYVLRKGRRWKSPEVFFFTYSARSAERIDFCSFVVVFWNIYITKRKKIVKSRFRHQLLLRFPVIRYFIQHSCTKYLFETFCPVPGFFCMTSSDWFAYKWIDLGVSDHTWY